MSENGISRGAALAGAVVIAALSGLAGRMTAGGGAAAPEAQKPAAVKASTGGGAGELAAPSPEARLRQAEEKIAALETSKASLEKERATLAEAKTASEKKAEEAAAKLAALEKKSAEELAAAKAAGGAGGAGAEAKKKLRVGFGKWGELKELTGVDWAEAGGAGKNMNALLGELLYKLEHGEQITPELGTQIGQENMKLVKVAFAGAGKLPTNAMGNGEFTHPVVLANFVAAHLEAMGRPLDDGQVAAIARLGDEYDGAWERTQSGYDEETLGCQKIMDELELKLAFADGMRAVLTPEQRALIEVPGITDVLALDVHSPMLMLMGCAVPVAMGSRDAIRDQVAKGIATLLGNDDPAKAKAIELANAFMAETAPRLDPVPAGWKAAWIPRPAAILGGRATVHIRKEVLKLLPADSTSRANLIAERSIAIPRLVPDEDEKGGPK